MASPHAVLAAEARPASDSGPMVRAAAATAAAAAAAKAGGLYQSAELSAAARSPLQYPQEPSSSADLDPTSPKAKPAVGLPPLQLRREPSAAEMVARLPSPRPA